MKTFIKYPGGKEKELNIIIPNLPKNIDSFYEPFVGGGSVYFSMPNCHKYYINDKSKELMYIYKCIKSNDSYFYNCISSFDNTWEKISRFCLRNKEFLINCFSLEYDLFISNITKFLKENHSELRKYIYKQFLDSDFKIDDEIKSHLISKYNSIKKIQSVNGKLSSDNDIYDNIVCAFKSTYYTYLRYVYSSSKGIITNKGIRASLYFFIREYCYSSMFRFNSQGEFNVPYGGISYNEKYLNHKIDLMKSDEYKKRLRNTVIGNKDFYYFMSKHIPNENDFLFLDPPYDTKFSTYDNISFNNNDQKRLAQYLIDECKCNFMLIIKNTELIRSLYLDGTKCANNNFLNVTSFDKTYLVSFKNRNDKKCEHLMIKNY